MEDWCRISRDLAGNFLADLLESRRSDRDVTDSIQARRPNLSRCPAALFTFSGTDRELLALEPR